MDSTARKDSAMLVRDGKFRKSTYSNSGSCVEVAVIDGAVKVRNSNDADEPQRPTVRFTDDEWRAFVAGVKNGEFDL